MVEQLCFSCFPIKFRLVVGQELDCLMNPVLPIGESEYYIWESFVIIIHVECCADKQENAWSRSEEERMDSKCRMKSEVDLIEGIREKFDIKR